MVNALALAQRVMAKTLVAGSSRVPFNALLAVSRFGLRWERRTQMPADPCDDSHRNFGPAVAAIRRRAIGGDLNAEIVGHFGTFGDAIAPLLKASLEILERSATLPSFSSDKRGTVSARL